MDPTQDAAFRIFSSFLGTFAAVRLLTHGIRHNWLPLGNIVLGSAKGKGLHVHHLVWGIIALLTSGYASLTTDSEDWRLRLSVLYGFGAALTFDEFSLWLRLTDDYWDTEGRLSIDAVIILSTLFGLGFGFTEFWSAYAKRLRLASAGFGKAGNRRST